MAWRYACNIPTYITGKDEKGEPVVLFRINVFFQQQSPDGGGHGGSNGAPATDSAPFFVLRRYSQFRHLHDQLKAAFPAAMSGRGMAPPPKHPLVLGDKRDALERRRQELERWLWRLVGTAEVARASQLKAFLELDKALARAQQQQQRQRAEQQQRLMPDVGLPSTGGLDFGRGSSGTAPPSESGYGPAGAGGGHRHLAAFPGGGGGASVLGDDSASDASGPSGAASTAEAPSSLMPSATAARGAGGGEGQYVMPPDPRIAGTGRGEHEAQHPSHRHRQHPQQHGSIAAAHVFGGGGGADTSAAGGARAAYAARLGIHLQSRADIRRLVDVLIQRLETACYEAAAAVSEASMLRDANRAMAERLGELELERAGAGAEESQATEAARAALAESEAARSSLEQRLVQLEESLAGRSTTHAQQMSQLQSQLAEARVDNGELLRRLQEWDVSGDSTTATLAAQQRADELQQRFEEEHQRLEEQRRLVDEQRLRLNELCRLLDEQTSRAEEQQQRVGEQRRRADELQQQVDEHARRLHMEEQRAVEVIELQARLQRLGRELEERGAAAAALQTRLGELERQLADERSRREQPPPQPPPSQPPPSQPPPQSIQALLDRACADNALLAAEVQRLRSAGAVERDAHRTQLAAHSQASAQLAARVRELERQLAAATAPAAAAVQPQPQQQQQQPEAQTQELLLL